MPYDWAVSEYIVFDYRNSVLDILNDGLQGNLRHVRGLHATIPFGRSNARLQTQSSSHPRPPNAYNLRHVTRVRAGAALSAALLPANRDGR
jgi:hypothetical protein